MKPLYILLFLIVFNVQAVCAPLPTVQLSIGKHTFEVEVATRREELKNGLMHREILAPDKGMLFIYSRPLVITVWMKNTLIPLDMIFVDEHKKIVHIHHSATPHSLKKISSRFKSLYFVELNGGTCKRLGIEVGQRVVF